MNSERLLNKKLILKINYIYWSYNTLEANKKRKMKYLHVTNKKHAQNLYAKN